MKLYVTAMMAIVITTPIAAYTQEARTGMVKLRTNCTTDHTGGDGVRHDCTDREEYTAPPGFVLDQQSIAISKPHGNGSEHYCRHEFSEFRRVIPNLPITQPGKVVITGHARSPRGHWAGRGWVACEATVMQVDIPKVDAAQTQAFVSAFSSQGVELSEETGNQSAALQTDIEHESESLVSDDSPDMEFEAFNSLGE